MASRWSHLEQMHVVRLNAVLHPNDVEVELYKKYHLNPVFCEPATPEEIIPYVQDCDALFAVSVSLPTPVIESLRRCKVISRLGTGTDKIDVATATRRGILVTNVPLFCIHEQADHTMMLILALERKLKRMDGMMRQGLWQRSKSEGVATHRLAARTLGLVGFGNSARETAKRARSFGMRVLATRRRMDAGQAEAAALGVEMTDLDTVLRESDYVSLHIPLNRETYHLIDETALRKMKRDAFLINTARGAIVDEMALVRVLQEGHLAGAGIDTYEHIDVFVPEGNPPNHPLLELENVLLTPHSAGLSVEAKRDVAVGGVENVVSILSGHWPHPDHIVNRGVEPWFPLKPYDPALFETACEECI
ncbi:MAG TPA: C-terminal binding protein [Caldilineaceae bacterium]|nr:C-terminal binding protein [Caldilineaceae bacterium]